MTGDTSSFRLRGLIFDFDGTLADTLPVIFTAFRRAFQEHTGRRFTDAQIEALFGLNEEGILRRVVGEPDWPRALETYLAEYEASHGLVPEPFPGILDVLDLLEKRAVATAVVTGKGDGSTAISLDRLDMRRRFTLVETGSPDAPNKPAAIGRIVAAWGSGTDGIAYLGDAAGDMEASRLAGVLPLAAAYASTARGDELAAQRPAAIFRTVGELNAWIDKHAQGPQNT